MTVLHLGVVDMPYAGKGSTTTGDVAEILEAKYALFQVFWDIHQAVIQHDIENSLGGALETMIQNPGGTHSVARALASATSDIETLFRDAIDKQTYDHRIRGVPTQAALNGVKHSLKHPYAKRGPRPSFYDTGLLASSMRAWVED